MATQHVDLYPGVATNVTSELALVSGTSYGLQAQGGGVLFSESAATPDPGARPSSGLLLQNVIQPFEQGAENLYAWAVSGKARLVVLDAA